jgi:hypothetical protein
MKASNAVLALGQLVQDIVGLVHPTALAARPRPHLLDRLPEADGAVGNRELGSHRKPPPFEIEEKLFPRLRALAHAVDELNKPIPLSRSRARVSPVPRRASLTR